MFDKLQTIETRYHELMGLLSDGAVQSDPNQYRRHSKALSEIQPVVERFRDYKTVAAEIGEARELAGGSDAELKELAEQELSELETRRDDLLAEIRILMVPKDPNDEKNVVLEIRAGTGGDEAGLFAGHLFRMYRRFAEGQRWKVDILSINESGVGAIKEVVALIEGTRVYSRLKYESGVHRVQRVPATEASGRIHTSTATSRCSPRPRRWTSPSTPRTSASTRSARAAPAASMSIPPTPRCASPTCRPASSCRSRTRSLRSRTRRRR